ncbi:hypothetical protein V8C42DRAFT_324337 [Trichoderma barbatum]
MFMWLSRETDTRMALFVRTTANQSRASCLACKCTGMPHLLTPFARPIMHPYAHLKR